MRIELPCREECSACGACLAVCPVEAIQMKESDDGFQYPAIQEDKCVHCGKCIQVCTLRLTEEKHTPLEAYAAVGRCDSLIKKSSSGGVFASLAMQCINEGGLVSGAVMDRDGKSVQVYHMLADCAEGIVRMQGSKYVQSDAWKCYKEIILAVRQGKQVLFSGTPCQVSAVKRLTGDPDNLITIDIICHGVPSLRMLNDHVEILNRRFRGKISQVVFRDKSSRKNFCARIDVERRNRLKQLYIRAHYLSYYQYFLEGTIYRDSCYRCPYACVERISDITIGDYWGIEKHHSEALAKRNTTEKTDWSCILTNTPKGKAFLSKYGEMLEMYPSKAIYVAEQNQQLNAPSNMPVEREEIMRLYREKGYSAIEREFIRRSGGRVRYLWRLYKDMRRNGLFGKTI